MDWEALYERRRDRYEEGATRLEPEQLVRMGNTAYAAGLALLMLGRVGPARAWLARAAERWRESWEHATPTSWGRPIGTIKASLIADDDEASAEYARWTLGLGTLEAESPIGRYAGTLALLTLERWADAAPVAESLLGRDDFPPAVAGALRTIADGDAPGCAAAIEAVVESFETREEYLEDVPVADTALVLQALAARRGVAVSLRPSRVLPA